MAGFFDASNDAVCVVVTLKVVASAPVLICVTISFTIVLISVYDEPCNETFSRARDNLGIIVQMGSSVTAT
ncbi:Hypotetical protein [Plasmodium gaboni]|uniref:Hypotetical protein n=1 Tax=Plasmodium gaboni TaxID=647221 RepID=A0ABY1UVE2_9APIC|nr:Hypotetical protein [Plasmodium gaboni]